MFIINFYKTCFNINMNIFNKIPYVHHLNPERQVVYKEKEI